MFFDVWWPIVWILGAFLVPELIAQFDKKPGGTFSEWIWTAFALWPDSQQRFKHLRRWSFGCFFVSLGLHLMFQATVWLLIIYSIPAVLSVVYWWRNER